VEADGFFLEIGIWRGAWIISQLINSEKDYGIGIDPYKGLDRAKKVFQENLTRYELNERFSLFESAVQLKKIFPDIRFSVCHIDGEHTEDAVSEDLKFTSENLSYDGIIIVDDYTSLEHPGIGSAVIEFLSAREFAAFMISKNKIYLCRKVFHEKTYNVTRNLLKENNFNFLDSIDFSEMYHSEISGIKDLKKPTVCGSPVLLVKNNSKLNEMVVLLDPNNGETSTPLTRRMFKILKRVLRKLISNVLNQLTPKLFNKLELFITKKWVAIRSASRMP